jgi:hypothetical protein
MSIRASHRLIAPAGTDWQVGISSGSIEGLSLALESLFHVLILL